MSEEETTGKNELLLKVQDKAKSWFTSPTLVWFGSLYFYVLFSMIAFNVSREGFNADGFFGGPEYYMDLFLTYGLNSTPEEVLYTSPYAKGILAWVMAPFIAVWLGVTLFFLKRGGFAYNGTTFKDPSGTLFFAFFSKSVYGYEINIVGLKGNLFYLGIIWIPIFMATITTIMYKRKVKRETSIVTRFFFSVIISFWIAMEMAKITDPSIIFSMDGLFESLFVDRKYNNFVQYDGHYHPTNLATALALFHITLLILFSLVDNIETAYLAIRRQIRIYNQQRVMLQERIAQGVAELPWEEQSTAKSNEETT